MYFYKLLLKILIIIKKIVRVNRVNRVQIIENTMSIFIVIITFKVPKGTFLK